MDPIISFISQLLLGATVVIVGLEGIMSLLDRMGFLPSFLDKVYTSRDRRLTTMALQELGLVDKRPLIRQVVDYWRSEALATNIDPTLALRAIDLFYRQAARRRCGAIQESTSTILHRPC